MELRVKKRRSPSGSPRTTPWRTTTRFSGRTKRDFFEESAARGGLTSQLELDHRRLVTKLSTSYSKLSPTRLPTLRVPPYASLTSSDPAVFSSNFKPFSFKRETTAGFKTAPPPPLCFPAPGTSSRSPFAPESSARRVCNRSIASVFRSPWKSMYIFPLPLFRFSKMAFAAFAFASCIERCAALTSSSFARPPALSPASNNASFSLANRSARCACASASCLNFLPAAPS
mmetsp:Transcript_14329/g.61413  ORF Transcript_14329/g.61413 Transcript_14329/m.61413 type:complete len:229 (+) Transcript_14329:6939-7625(+)